MFERFTDKARRVVALAQEEALQLGHTSIGTEHLLLGLLRENGGPAARALETLGVGLQPARDQVAASAGRGPGPTAGHIPFTPEAKRALQLSLDEAFQLGQTSIDTEHILLALVADPAARGAQILSALGGTPEAVRLRVGGRVRAPAEPTGGYGPLSTRLAALERWAGLAPDLADLDEQIAQIRQDTEAAIDAHEFRTAEALSDSERELVAERDRRSRQRAAGPSLAEQVARLQAEVERLRTALRQHGIEPGSESAPTAS